MGNIKNSSVEGYYIVIVDGGEAKAVSENHWIIIKKLKGHKHKKSMVETPFILSDVDFRHL